MLLLILAWVFLLLIVYVIGRAILQITDCSMSKESIDQPFIHYEYIVATWLGMISLSVILLIISLFLKLSFSLFLLTAAILVSLSLCSAPVRPATIQILRRCSSIQLMSLMMILIFSAFISTARIKVYDTGLYHIQLIKWLSEFGTVPGLALLHSRFGFTSSWFALSAPWNTTILAERAIALTGGLVLTVTLIHFMISIQAIVKRGIHSRDVIPDLFFIGAIVFCLPFLVVGGFITSTSPDVPAAILIIEVAWSILVIANNPFQHSNLSVLPLILASGAVGIKLSTLPILLIAFIFYCCYSCQKVVPKLVKAIIIMTVMLGPILLINIVSSGCPLFPSSLLCLNVEWSVGVEVSHSISTSIQHWARWLGPKPENANNFNWLLHWLGHRKEATFLLFSSFLSAFIVWRMAKQNEIKGSRYLVATGLLGMTFMLIKAPDTRFGLGFLVILPSFLIALIIQARVRLGIGLLLVAGLAFYILSVKSTAWHILLVTVTSVAYLGSLSVWYLEHKQQETLMILMPAVLFFLAFFPHSQFLGRTHPDLNRAIWPPKIKAVKVKAVKPSFVSHSQPAEGDRCFAAPLPCTPVLTHPNIQFRDPELGLKGGFKRF